MRRGQSFVVWAISEGRECARKVDEYLMGIHCWKAKIKIFCSTIITAYKLFTKAAFKVPFYFIDFYT